MVLTNHIYIVLDYLTVNETAKEPPQDEEGKNSPSSLAIEATYINQNFSQQMLVVKDVLSSTHYLSRACTCTLYIIQEGMRQYSLPQSNPFAGEEQGEVASVAYR